MFRKTIGISFNLKLRKKQQMNKQKQNFIHLYELKPFVIHSAVETIIHIHFGLNGITFYFSINNSVYHTDFSTLVLF